MSCVRQTLSVHTAQCTVRSLVTSDREARSEFLLIYTKNLNMSGRPARRPAVVTLLRGLYLWNRKPDCQRSSLVGSPIPSAVYGTNAESCQCQLWHVARAT